MFDFEKFKSFMFLPIFIMLIFSISTAYYLRDNLEFYQKQVYTSWETQQEYSETLRQEINLCNNNLKDVNTDLQIYKISLIYEKEMCLK